MKKIIAITQKEFNSFFSSPIAYIFLGCFALVAMFMFFTVDTFFARNIADLRPLFNSLPLILIFLVAAISMKMWSEERKLGTIEFLFTCPVKVWQLVLGRVLGLFVLGRYWADFNY